MSLEQQLTKVTGEGSALTYFSAYLQKILPTITDDIHQWCGSYEIPEPKTSFKFYIIVPLSGQCPDNFTAVDNKIQPSSKGITDIPNPRAGDQSRKLTRSMHVINDGDEKYYFCGEFASPLKTLQGIFNLVEQKPEIKEMHKAQVEKFAALMEDLNKFEQTKQYAQKFEIVRFDEADQRPLSEVMLKCIKGSVAKRQEAAP